MRWSRVWLSLLVVSTLLVGSVAAIDRPTRVCGVCDPNLDHQAHVQGVDVSSGESRLLIDLDADGDSHWTARVELLDGASTLQESPALRRELVRAALANNSFLDAPTNVSSRIDGQTLVVTYEEPGLARQSVGGVLLIDRFYTVPFQSVFANTNALTISGPSGYAVTARSATFSVSGAAVVAERGGMVGRIDSEALIAFAPGDGPLAGVTTALAMSVAVGPVLLVEALIGVSGATLVLAGVAGLLLRLRRGREPLAPHTTTKLVVVTGPLLALTSTWLILPRLGFLAQTPVHLALVLAAAATLAPFALDGPAGRRTVYAMTAVVVGVAPGALLLLDVVGPTTAIGLAGWTAALALFVPLGYVRRQRSRLALVAAILVSPVLAVLPNAPVGQFTSQFATGYLAGFALLFLAPTAVTLFLAGWALADQQ